MSEYRWLNDLSQQFLDRGYLLEGQSVDERVDIICNTAEKILKKPGFAARLKENFKKGWYSFSTPVWCNFGTDRGFGISCFGSHVDDTMDSILYTSSEIGMMSKYGGGTSAYFGDVRPRGSNISNNGKSSGSVHFMQLFESIANIVSQGSSRRGHCAVYLPIDHKDINEFLKIRTEGFPIQDLSYGVCVSDEWMQSMIDGDAEKRSIWAKVLEARTNVGYPYIYFTDNANNNSPECYKDKYRINHSNMCVTGDQRVVSNHGLLTAKELYDLDEELVLYDNKKSVNASKMMLMEENTKVYKITLENGMTHTVTDYHKVLTSYKKARDYREISEIKQCKDLKIGDRVAVQTNKGLFGDKSMKDEALLLGLYQSDGTQHKDSIQLCLWENDFDLIDEVEEKFNNVKQKYINEDTYYTKKKLNDYVHEFKESHTGTSTVRKKTLASVILKRCLNFEKGYIPQWIWESDEETQWEYVRGLLYADGSVHIANSTGNPIQINYVDINYGFLEELQVLFANLGMQTSIRVMSHAGEKMMPDGKGSHKLYNCKDSWRLIVGNKNDALTIENKTGFLSRKGIKLENRKYRNNTKKFYKIKSIEYVGREDVYCCKVDSNDHLWVCNGIITHNCSEIMLPNNNNESFVCNLSSMNILYYDEWKDTDAVELLVYLLDAVMTDFIKRAGKIRFMERAVEFAKNHRALGIGWLGWHSYLQSKMIPWESMEAKLHNSAIAKDIKEKAYLASEKLATDYGESPVCKGTGRRNATLLAIAPTKSSAFIIGQVSEGIEPHRSNYYIKDLQKGKYTIKNKELESLLESKSKNTDGVWKSILQHGGSVQHLDFLTKKEKNVFKTFGEISQKEIIIQASQRQQYIDQGQSLNIMIHPSTSIKDINKLMIETWKLGIKSLYYQFSVNAAQEFSRNLLSCESCE